MDKINKDSFSINDCYNISDIWSYLYQYECEIVRSENEHMLPFCCDIALKRLFLYDEFGFCFLGENVNREDILSDIREHIDKKRCTEYSVKVFNNYSNNK